MPLLFGAFARIKANRLQLGTTQSYVKFADIIVDKPASCNNGGRAVVWLHENRAKSISTPVGFEEGGFGVIIPGKAGAGSNAELDFIKE